MLCAALRIRASQSQIIPKPTQSAEHVFRDLEKVGGLQRVKKVESAKNNLNKFSNKKKHQNRSRRDEDLYAYRKGYGLMGRNSRFYSTNGSGEQGGPEAGKDAVSQSTNAATTDAASGTTNTNNNPNTNTKSSGKGPSTLSNLENLYAAFAKQQKEKAAAAASATPSSPSHSKLPKKAPKKEESQESMRIKTEFAPEGDPMTLPPWMFDDNGNVMKGNGEYDQWLQVMRRAKSKGISYTEALAEEEAEANEAWADEMEAEEEMSSLDASDSANVSAAVAQSPEASDSSSPSIFTEDDIFAFEDDGSSAAANRRAQRPSWEMNREIVVEGQIDPETVPSLLSDEVIETNADGEPIWPKLPRTLEEMMQEEEMKMTAKGTYDPTSPEAMEFKKRCAPVVCRSKSEEEAVENKLIARHKAAVQERAWILNDLELSADMKFDPNSRLSPDLHPFLYNEKYALGLTPSELKFLQGRSKWNALVEEKRTKIALRRRNLKEESELVDELFVQVVNKLATNSEDLSQIISKEDVLNRVKAVEARDRISRKLQEIYMEYPHQWTMLLEKYLPKSRAIAEKVFDREFWSPSNPWIMAAFTKSLIEEAQNVEKMIAPEPVEAEIHERLMETGELREDDITDQIYQGPLGQTSGTSAADDARDLLEQREEESRIGCLFCSPHRHRFPLEPMNVPLLARFMNTNGKILPRSSSGLCKRHQPKMANAIKRARHLNLFTYKHSEYSINNPMKPAYEFGTPEIGKMIYRDPFSKEGKAAIAASKRLTPEEQEVEGFAPDHANALYREETEDDPTQAVFYEAPDQIGQAMQDISRYADDEQLMIEAIESEEASSEEYAIARAAEAQLRREARQQELQTQYLLKKEKEAAKRKVLLGADDAFEDQNDDIGNMMVKQALETAARKYSRSINREKEDL